VLQDQRKLDEARALLVRTLSIFERAHGPDHPRVGLTLYNLGLLQLDMQDHAAALETFRRSAPIFEAKLGKDHVVLSYALRGIGGCLVKLGRTTEALPLLERAATIRAASGEPPVVIGEVQAGLSEVLARDPRTRARELAGARAAAARYEQTGDTRIAAEVRRWLDKHR
jgi:tetratricopeptide (TPR) repeat protein